VVRDLLAAFKTDLVNLEILFIYQVGKPPLLLLEDLLFFNWFLEWGIQFALMASLKIFQFLRDSFEMSNFPSLRNQRIIPG
jgi:hypothetical protein